MPQKGNGTYNQLLMWEEPTDGDMPAEQEDQRGRDPELVANRNEQILHRYVQYAMPGTLRQDYILQLLKEEFYLSESTLGQMVDDNAAIVFKIRREWPGEKALEKRYRLTKWLGVYASALAGM